MLYNIDKKNDKKLMMEQKKLGNAFLSEYYLQSIQNSLYQTMKKKKHSIVTDLLDSIVVTAPVFHFEMSELKAELYANAAQ